MWQWYVWNNSGKNDHLHLPGALVQKILFCVKIMKEGMTQNVM